MSNTWRPSYCSPADPEYGCIGANTISFHKDRLGWVPPSQKYSATTSPDQNVSLDRLGTPSSGGYLMAQIPIGGSTTRFYTVEARRFVGYDERVPAEAVVIHKVDTTLPDRNAQVVDPDANSDPNDAGARWLPGETFTDAANGISVRVDDVSVSGFDVTINPSAAPPPNDNFADAQAIGGSTASVDGTTSRATREVDEPDHYTSNPADADWRTGDHSVWYSWTAPSSGSTTIDTCAANIDSILAVYTGDQLNNLTRVADNNNDLCGGGWGSKVTFRAVAGTTYRIAVADAGGLRESTFTLKLADTEAPTVDNVTPPDGKTRVQTNTNVTATFSEEMDAATLTDATVRLVRDGAASPITATVSYDAASKTVTVNPSSRLARRTEYTATIQGGPGGAKDAAGNPLATDEVWSFTTSGRR